LSWFDKIPAQAFYLSVLTIREIRKGIEKLPTNARKTKLLLWLEHEIPTMFSTRILDISIAVADRWGRL
jgi:hypothetical protein